VESSFVHAQRVARLATADANGCPHVVPICFAFDGSRFFSVLDEKPKRVADRGLRRVRNIQENAKAAIVFDRYDEDWSRLGFVLVRGRAILLPPGEGRHDQAIESLRARYPQYGSMAIETRPVIELTPESVTSWGHLG
jgi:PPOX class probable F420-dependent enzyme